MFNEFLRELSDKNIVLSFSNGKMQYKGPEEYIDEELISRLKNYKAKLLKHFWPKECTNMLPFNTEGDLTPLILLHAGEYFKISDYLEYNHPFYGFYYIGSESEKIRHKSVEAFADEYLRQLLNIIPDGPFYLGGMSFGGVVAYEMANKLVKMGKEVPLLIMGDCGLIAYESPIYYSKLFRKLYHGSYEFLRSVYNGFFYNRQKFIYELFPSLYFSLSINKRTSYMVDRYGEMLEKYKPTTEFKGEILLFRASENNFNSEYLGWEKLCKNITLVPFIGTHGSLFDDKTESVSIIKNHVREKIKEIENKNKRL
jgi:hypothetical protein